MSDHELRRELHQEANRVLIDAEYTGRQHMLYARHWRRCAIWMGLPSVVLAALASGAAGVTALLGIEGWVTALLGLSGAAIGGVRSFFRPDEQAARHGRKGEECITIRNRARLLMNIELRLPLSCDALADRAQALRSSYDALRSREPTGLPEWTYRTAKKEITAGNYDYEGDLLWRDYEGVQQPPEQS